jgi:hypothetical protein
MEASPLHRNQFVVLRTAPGISRPFARRQFHFHSGYYRQLALIIVINRAVIEQEDDNLCHGFTALSALTNWAVIHCGRVMALPTTTA